MDYVKININSKIVLPSTDYYTASNKYPAPKEPELWLIEDGNGAILMFPDRIYQWISPQNFNCFEVCAAEEKTELTAKPNQSIIDSSTLLKAIAIAQQPDLALNLLKE